MPFTSNDDIKNFYLALWLECFFFGLYSGIFALHLQIHAFKTETDKTKQNTIFYALCVLYVLSVGLNAINIELFIFNNDNSMLYCLDIARTVVFGCCDFIAQSILIHRCWIVWGHNNHVVIIPSVLTFTSFVMWIASSGALFIGQGDINETEWGDILDLTGLTASMTVNALVTGLIVFRIFKVFREVKSATSSDKKYLGVTGETKLQSIIFIIIESGMALFAIQLARLVLISLVSELSTTAEVDTYQFIISIHEMLNGITPTIILVRVSMGLSFHDEPSLVEAIGGLEFADNDSNSTVGTGSFNQYGSLHIEPDDPMPILEMVNISQERKDDESGGSDDIIRMVDR